MSLKRQYFAYPRTSGMAVTAQPDTKGAVQGRLCTQHFAPMFRPVRLDAFPPLRYSSNSLSLSTLQPTEVSVQRSHDYPYALEYVD